MNSLCGFYYFSTAAFRFDFKAKSHHVCFFLLFLMNATCLAFVSLQPVFLQWLAELLVTFVALLLKDTEDQQFSFSCFCYGSSYNIQIDWVRETHTLSSQAFLTVFLPQYRCLCIKKDVLHIVVELCTYSSHRHRVTFLLPELCGLSIYREILPSLFFLNDGLFIKKNVRCESGNMLSVNPPLTFTLSFVYVFSQTILLSYLSWPYL